MVANHLWKFFQNHEWMLVFHSFGELPPAVAPLLRLNVIQAQFDGPVTIVPAEKRLIIGEEVHWGFLNRKPAKTLILIHKI